MKKVSEETLFDLGQRLEAAHAGKREDHDRLLEWYQRLYDLGYEIPEELATYIKDYLAGDGPKLRAASKYKPWQDQAIAMKMFSNMTQEEIAEKLDVSVNTLKDFLKKHRKRRNGFL